MVTCSCAHTHRVTSSIANGRVEEGAGGGRARAKASRVAAPGADLEKRWKNNRCCYCWRAVPPQPAAESCCCSVHWSYTGYSCGSRVWQRRVWEQPPTFQPHLLPASSHSTQCRQTALQELLGIFKVLKASKHPHLPLCAQRHITFSPLPFCPLLLQLLLLSPLSGRQGNFQSCLRLPQPCFAMVELS